MKKLNLKPNPWNKNTKGIIKSNSGSFKKGMIPWNKGKKLPQFSGKNHPNWKFDKKPYWRYKRNCNQCNKYYEGCGQYFCSRKCRSIWTSKNKSQEKSSLWKGGKPKCLDCGNEVSNYGIKRCRKCNDKYRITTNGHPWINGLTKCIDCKKQLYSYGAKRCQKCNSKFQVGKNNPFYGKKHTKKLKEKWSIERKGKRTGSDSPEWKGGKPYCKNCNKQLWHYTQDSKTGLCGNCYWDSMSNQRGEKHWNWKGGVSTINRLIYSSERTKRLFEQSKQRDNYQCLMPNCDSNDKYVETNHIKLFSKIIKENNIKTTIDARKCRELWDINNLITLCRSCHRYIRGREEQFEKLFHLIVNKLYGEQNHRNYIC